MTPLWRMGAWFSGAALAMVAACDGGPGALPTFDLARQENPGSGFDKPGSGFNSPGSGFNDPGSTPQPGSGGASSLCVTCNINLLCTEIKDNAKPKTDELSLVPATGGCGVVGSPGLVLQCDGKIVFAGQELGTWTATPDGFSSSSDGVETTCVVSGDQSTPPPDQGPSDGTSTVVDAGTRG